MSWDIVENKGFRNRGFPTIRFSGKYNCSLSASLSRMTGGGEEHLTFYIGSGDDAGKISFIVSKTKSTNAFKISSNKSTNVKHISARKFVNEYGLHQKTVRFEKVGDRFVGEIPREMGRHVQTIHATQKPQTEKTAPAVTKAAPAKEIIQKKDPPEKPETPEKTSTKKEILSVQFSKNTTCRLSKGLGVRAGLKSFIHVEKVPGQKELRVWFTKKPGDNAFALNKYGSGLGFIGTAFAKLFSLDGKTIQFEADDRSQIFYGILD